MEDRRNEERRSVTSHQYSSPSFSCPASADDNGSLVDDDIRRPTSEESHKDNNNTVEEDINRNNNTVEEDINRSTIGEEDMIIEIHNGRECYIFNGIRHYFDGGPEEVIRA